jgi:plastocyanin
MKITVALVASMLLLPAQSVVARPAEPLYVLSGPGAQFAGYATPVVVIQKGGALEYTNLDIVQHDVVHDVEADGISSKRKRPWCSSFHRGHCPLFWSKRAGLGSTVPVKGVASLKTGKIYTFFCTLHPGMKGKLVVGP